MKKLLFIILLLAGCENAYPELKAEQIGVWVCWGGNLAEEVRFHSDSIAVGWDGETYLEVVSLDTGAVVKMRTSGTLCRWPDGTIRNERADIIKELG